MKITLKEHKDLKSILESYKEPESLDELIEMKELKASLDDNGITRFKEITDFNRISFGHFIVIEKIITHETLDYESKLEMIATVILRPLDEGSFSNDDKDIEEAHRLDILEESLGNVAGAFNRLLELRNTYLYKTYNGVIYATQDDDKDNEEEKEEGTSVNSGQSARGFHSKKFFWHSMISMVANGDIFKFDKVVELMMYQVMPFLAEKRSLEIVEYLEHKASTI